MTSARPRLLGVFPFAPGTGFTRVMTSILEGLPEGWDLHCLATRGTRGERWLEGVELHSSRRKPEEPSAVEECRALAERLRPHLVLLLDDPPVVARYAQALYACRPRPRVVAHCPVDGFLGNPQTLGGLETVDRLVSFTRFGREQLAGCLDRSRTGGSDGPCLTSIPLGLDTQTFVPLGAAADPDRRRRALKELFPERPDLHGSFIVLNANTCHPRKRIETTLWGFATFAEGKPRDVRLYLHHLAPGRPFYEDLIRLVRALGITDRLIPSLLLGRSAARFSDSRMNVLYNACAVGVNTSEGEGWGLVSMEHAATGAAQIVPRHGALAELWAGAATCLPPRCAIGSTQTVERCQVSSSSLAAALEELYQEPRILRKKCLSCYERATDQRWARETVSARWRDLLERECCRYGADAPDTHNRFRPRETSR